MLLKTLISRPLYASFLAVLCGIGTTFAFAPFEIFPLAVICPAILLALWLPVSPKIAFLRGGLYGIGLFGSGVYWVYISIHTYGNTSIPFAVAITFGFVLILSFFPAMTGYLLNYYFPNNTRAKMIFAFPTFWVLLEWIRSWIFTGFPWLLLGYSQIYSPLKGYASIYSVFGVSLATLFTAGLLVCAINLYQRKELKTFYKSLITLAIIWIIGGALCFMHWTKPEGNPIKMSLVQGNIPQSLKWSPEQVQPTLNTYEQLTNQHWDSQIIIWPESALPIILQDAYEFLDKMNAAAKKHNSTIITGIPVESPEPGSYYNAIIMLGKGHGAYAKQRLVPFGEYIPFQKTFKKFFDILQIPMSDFVSGPSGFKPLQIDNLKIAPYICYEIAFPEQVLRHDKTIGMILTISNDAWFGHSIAQAQHLEMGQMRAVEMQRPVIFVSNNGLTGVIKPDGNIQAIAPAYQQAVLTDTVQAYTGQTPWQKTGLDSTLILLLFFFWIAYKQRKQV